MNKKHWLFLLTVSVVVLAALPGGLRPESVAAAPLQQTNLLTNPGFEQPFTSGAASGWARWHRDTGKLGCETPYAVQPTWAQEANTALIRDGATSQHIGNTWDTWHAGVMQTVNVTAGTRYRFTFWSIGRASQEQFPAPSDTSVGLGVRAGIDPNGSGLWSDADIVWGASGSPHDSGNQANWLQFTVEATAAASQITVFVSADVSPFPCRAKHYDMWFDAAQLIEIAPPPTNTPLPPPPPPPATNTPRPPTATATPAETPTNTPEPTAIPTNTPEPPQGGVICVNAFADDNANGQHEPTEGFMAGVTFTIAQGDQVVAQGISPGSSTAVCFENVPAGNYIIAQVVPRNLEMTTAGSTTLDVVEGATISLEFGSRIKPDTGPEPAATATAIAQVPGETPDGSGGDSGGGLSLLAISGLVAILVAIGLLGALIFILLRQQRS